MNISERVLELVATGSPERLDRWIAAQVSDLSRSHAQKLIEQCAVQINGAVCTAKKATVGEGDRVRLKIPPPVPLTLEPEPIPLDILYEDDQLLVINKPAGMVVHPAPGHPGGTLVNAVLAHCGNQLAGVGGILRPGIVHRLDKDTTGAIVVAKTELALHSLQRQIQAKTARREYLGVVCGAPQTERGTISQPLGRHPKDRKKMAIVPIDQGGRPAVTHWQLKERLGHYSLLHFQLETGRTHQIRVHSASIGHSIVGDSGYGTSRSVGVNLAGQALHACRLSFSHPITQAPIIAKAPLPAEIETLLQRLRLRT